MFEANRTLSRPLMSSAAWTNAYRPPQQKSLDRFRVVWMKAYEQNSALVIKAREWTAAALEDGWRIEGKIYVQEPLRRACSLTRDSFRAIIIARDEPPLLRHLPAGCVTVWRGDVEILIPLVYSWEFILADRAGRPHDAV